MAATMAMQGDRVQLGQSDTCPASTMAKNAKGGFFCAEMKETQCPIKKPHAELRETKMWGVQFPGHENKRAAIERDQAILHQNHTAKWIPSPNGTAKNRQTCRRCNRPGVPLPNRCRQQIIQTMPPLPGRLPTPSGNISIVQCSQIINLLARYAYTNTSVHCAACFTHYTSSDPKWPGRVAISGSR